MKMWTGLLVLLLAVAGCSYQGEDPQGEKTGGGAAAPAETATDNTGKAPPAEEVENGGTTAEKTAAPAGKTEVPPGKTAEETASSSATVEKPPAEESSDIYSPGKDPLVNPDSLFEKAPEDPGKIARDETLVRYLKSDPGTLNPLFTSSIYESYVEDTLFDGLFTFNSDFEWIVNDSMVESLEKTEDQKTWTVKLRPGLKWHDGHPLSAHDVAFTWEAIMDDEVPTKTLRTGRDQLKSVTALDDLTVRFIHKEALPTGKWNMLYSILPKHIIGDKDNANRKEDRSLKKSPYYLKYAQAPVGCGPYKFVKWERNRKIVVERWDEYHGRKPHFKRQIFKVVKDPNQALNLFKKGELDEIEITPLQFATQTNDANFAKLGVKAFHPTWSYYCVGWNATMKPDKSNPFFTDRRVRRAMAHAANIQLVLKNLTYGLSRQASGIFQPGAWMYNEQVRLLAYDIGKARELLDEAGWEVNENDGVRYKEIDGEKVKFEFTLLIPQGSTLGPGFAAIFSEDLAQIGVSLKQQTMDFSALLDRLRGKNYEAFMLGWSTGIDPDTNRNLWHTEEAESGRNFVSYTNTRVDELFELSRRELDPVKRAGHFKEIHKLIYDDQPYMFILSRAATWAFHKRIRGVTFSPRGVFSVYPSHLDWWVRKEDKLR